MIRQAYREAVDFFLGAVAEVPAERWDSPALGVWTVRDLVGHTGRAMRTLLEYVDRPAPRADLHRPADYFIHVRGILSPTAITKRGRESGRALGDDPLAALQDLARRSLEALDRAPDGALLATSAGGMRLLDYLPTRVFELTVHTLDLARALGIELRPPESPAAVTLDLLGELARHEGQEGRVILALTGRLPLPAGFSVLGL